MQIDICSNSSGVAGGPRRILFSTSVRVSAGGNADQNPLWCHGCPQAADRSTAWRHKAPVDLKRGEAAMEPKQGLN